MKILNRLSQRQAFTKKAVVTIGVFDGMHRGHVRLIREVVRRARRQGGPAVVITFSPHPVHVLRPQIYCPLIVSLSHRLKIMASLGVDVCVVVPFRKSFSRVSPGKFIRQHLLRLFNPSEVIVGDDFRFGQARQGTLATFRQAAKEYGFKFSVIPTRVRGEKHFSSSRIREYILSGELQKAARLLGRPVALLGHVVHGDAIGRNLGYPTANINSAQELLPPSGIYIIHVHWRDRLYQGVAYIGRRPSIKKIGPVKVEAHIFNFHRDLYGQEILIEFLKKIREEKVFRSQDELVHQIRKDELVARRWFARK